MCTEVAITEVGGGMGVTADNTQLLPTPVIKLLAGTLRKREQVKKFQFRSSGNEILGRGP